MFQGLSATLGIIFKIIYATNDLRDPISVLLRDYLHLIYAGGCLLRDRLHFLSIWVVPGLSVTLAITLKIIYSPQIISATLSPTACVAIRVCAVPIQPSS